MSSIYQKGRDGYYYYQAYRFNPETGKKDKRIFHSLGTKDKEEAISKQNEYDKKYDNEKNKNSSTKDILSSKPYFNKIYFSAALIIITCNLYYDNNDNPELINHSNNTKENSSEIEKITKASKNEPYLLEQGKTKYSKIDTFNKIPEIEKTKISNQITMPNYQIIRIEKLSGAFEQGKLFITVDTAPDDKNMKLLCQTIKEQYKEFSNIIICVYSNTTTGIALANGFDADYSIYQRKKEWFAMYSFNQVEGEYYNDDPAGYLGVY